MLGLACRAAVGVAGAGGYHGVHRLLIVRAAAETDSL